MSIKKYNFFTYACTYMHINYICRKGLILCLATHTYTLCTYPSFGVHTYVTVLGKSTLWSNTVIHFLPVHESYTHALSRGT